MIDKHPLVTMPIFAYNQEKYIKEAVVSAFSQTYSPLEIIISDDCSTDNTFSIIKQLITNYNGKHTIRLNQNKVNLGIMAHLDKIINMASGEFIVIATGDDISLPKRVEIIVKSWLDSNMKYKSIFSNAIQIDENGNQLGLYLKSLPIYAKTLDDFIYDKRSFRIKLTQPSVWQLGATQAFEKSLLKIYGSPHKKAIQEDGIFAFRALLQGEVHYIDELLVKYRIHNSQVSNLNNFRSIKKLKVLQCYYKLTQLNDAKLTHFSNKRLINKLKYSYFRSKTMGLLHHIPFYSYSIFNLKKAIKRFL